jgi:hypothetical protein
MASVRRSTVHLWTTIAIAALAASLTVGLHEGVHALTCLAVGGELHEYSAHHVDCTAPDPQADRIVAGSASIANLLLGTLMLVLLRSLPRASGESKFFLWLFMLTNWCYGAGYWLFSGIGGVGDWAYVVQGWEPAGLIRLVMTLVGAAAFMLVVWLALRELGRIIGGTPDEQIGRAVRLGVIAYFTAVAVVFLAGLFNPYGLTGLPFVAGMLAVAGALSPLLWMMQWFRAASFAKPPGPPLEVHPSWTWRIAGLLVTAAYIFVLGPSLRF